MGVSAQVEGGWAGDQNHASGPVASAPLDPAEEAALILAAASGDHDAFGVLYDRYADRVYRHCYFRVGNRADAEDLTQQTFLHAWRALGRYRQQGVPLIAWLLAISQNLSTNHYRRARQVALSLDHVEEARHAPGAPEDNVLAGVRQDRIRRAIERLAPDRRHVILLRYIEEFTVAETALTLNKTESNVRVLQHRALNDLRRILSEPESPTDATHPSLLHRLHGMVNHVRRGFGGRR